MKELAKRFEDEHIAVHLKASTAKEYRRNLNLFILPAIGHLRIVDVTRADISKYHHDWRHRPYQANRNLEIISKMFNLAELWGLRPDGTNPRDEPHQQDQQESAQIFPHHELPGEEHADDDASSMTRFVEARRKASEGMEPAPFVESERVVASAAKEHEDEMKPKNVPRATLLAPGSPMDFFIRSLVTKTWLIEEIR